MNWLESPYDPAKDIRANDPLFCSLCAAALENRTVISSYKGGALVREAALECCTVSDVPERLASERDERDVRIYSENKGSVILARLYPGGDRPFVLPRSVGQAQGQRQVVWVHDATDTYRYEAVSQEAARKMYEEQVPEKRRCKNLSFEFEVVKETVADTGAPYTVIIDAPEGKRSASGIGTVAHAAVMALAEGCSFTIKDKDRKAILSYKPEKKDKVVERRETIAPQGADDAFAQKKVVVIGLPGGAVDSLPQLLGMLGLSENRGYGENAIVVARTIAESGMPCDVYGIVKEAGDGYVKVNWKERGISQFEAAKAISIDIDHAPVSMEGKCEFLAMLDKLGFSGTDKTLESSLFGKDGCAYSEQLGVGISVRRGSTAHQWSMPIYSMEKLDAAGIKERLSALPSSFFALSESRSLKIYLSGFSPVQAYSDLRMWENATCATPKRMNPIELLLAIEGKDGAAAKALKKYIANFPFDKQANAARQSMTDKQTSGAELVSK